SGGTSTVWSLPLMLRVIMLGLVLRVACSLLHDEELERHFHCRDFWGRTCNVFMAARRGSRYPTQPDAMRTVRISRPARYCTMVSILLLVLTRIVGGIQIFEAQRTNGRYLGDVLTGFGPVEVGRIARQNDDATGRIRLHLIAVELIAQADVEHAG